MKAKGFAARLIVNKQIMVKTVSPTPHAAMVNGIMALFGVMVYDHWDEHRIEKAWIDVQGSPLLYEIVPVEIAVGDDT